MPKLKCDVRSCIYNADYCCSRSVIKVSGIRSENSIETACDSFHRVKRKVNMDTQFKMEFSKIDGINQFVSIDCEAVNCIFNSKMLCSAPRVSIAGGSRVSKVDETICDTFINKSSDI